MHDVSVMDMGNGRFEINGYVDAENSFGADLQKDFSCVVKKNEGLDKWELEDLDFED